MERLRLKRFYSALLVVDNVFFGGLLLPLFSHYFANYVSVPVVGRCLWLVFVVKAWLTVQNWGMVNNIERVRFDELSTVNYCVRGWLAAGKQKARCSLT